MSEMFQYRMESSGSTKGSGHGSPFRKVSPFFYNLTCRDMALFVSETTKQLQGMSPK
jgi:hypothetical protein